MASFSAGVPVNIHWHPSGHPGVCVEIANGTATNRTPIAAGEAFTVPDAYADQFEAEFGAQSQPDRVRVVSSGVHVIEAQPDRALIAGLTRL